MDLNPAGIARVLLRSASGQSIYKEYARQYMRIESSIDEFDGLKARAHIYDVVGVDDALRLMLLMFDVTTLSLPDDRGFSNLPIPRIFTPDGSSIAVALPMDWGEHDVPGITQHQITPVLFGSWGDLNDRFIVKILPALQSGRIILRPVPRIEIRTFEFGQLINMNWLDLAPEREIDGWRLSGTSPIIRPTPMLGTNSARRPLREMLDITVPYIAGIPFADYIKILDDESDIISEFRAELKSVAGRIISSGESAEEIREDIIKPRLDAITRKLKSAAGLGRLATSADLGLGAVTLASFAFDFNWATLLATGGVTGWSIVQHSITRKKERQGITSDPMHVLWKLRKFRRGG